jgi:glycosyltransferase involved in cell wall biosynthesis
MKKKVLFKAPLLTRSGYGEQSRFALRALRSRDDLFDIFIQPLQWGATSWINTSDEERRWIDLTIEKTIAYIQHGGQFDISFQVTIPNEWEQIAPVNIGYTAGIETTRVAHQWIEKGNVMNNIVVVSNHSKNNYEKTVYQGVVEETGQQIELKLQTPIEVVNYPAKKFDDLPDLDIDFKHDINFISIAQFGPRKNLPNTIKWFVEEFHDDEVGFVVKTNLAKNCYMDRLNVQNQLRAMLSAYADRKCSVYLLHGDMEDDEIHSLYAHEKISALISLAHGEGFGLPIFEATYSGLPVICNGWSGQCDFVFDENNKEGFYNVAFDLSPVQENVVWDGVLIKESMWAYSREHAAKEQMRNCYNDIREQKEDSIALNACKFAEYTQERFAQEKQYEKMVNVLMPYVETEEEGEWRDILDQVVEYD